VPQIYDYPEYYEVAFSFRDIPSEVTFMERCIERFSRIPVRRILEVACGPAPHARQFVKRGYHFIGLDNNRNMLDYATYKWRAVNPRPELIEGDMVRFQLPGTVDFAFIMLGSLYIDSQAGMTSHFDSLSRCLNPGGLYFLDWCIQHTDPLAKGDSTTVLQERDGIAVESRFDIRLVDPVEHMYEEIWTLSVDDHGRHRTFEMHERNRAILPEEFLEFVDRRSDFEFVGWWKDWDLDQPITTNDNVGRPVAILRRL